MLGYLVENAWLIPVWCIANWAPMWFIILTYKRWNPDLHKEENYAPFLRTDYHSWSYVWTMWTHLFFWPRFIMLHVCSLALVIAGVLLKVGQD